jgi:hypothetical protein
MFTHAESTREAPHHLALALGGLPTLIIALMSFPGSVIQDLLPLVRQCCSGSVSVALGGSYAKQRSDSLSDIDLYVFTSGVLPTEKRTALVRDTLAGASEVISWGTDEPFVQGGTDFTRGGHRFECWFRSIERTETTVTDCLQGQIQRHYTPWTVMGLINYVLLSDLQSMQNLEDPHGMLARWKAAVRVYPEPLRQAILHRFLGEACFWPENPHYHSAVERADLIYTSGIVQQVLHALLQVVFALNAEYFPGEKNLLRAVAKLSVQPQDFGSRVHLLLQVGSGAVADLRSQQRTLGALVAEVQHLVSSHRGPGAQLMRAGDEPASMIS